MEILTMRFPHLSETIFDHLDNQSLANCNIVSKTWSDYIGVQKFYSIRIIKKTVLGVSNKLSKQWFEVFKKANTCNIKELKSCLDQFLKENCFNEGCTPLHIAAGVGNIILYESIHELAKNKQPGTEDGTQPVFYAIRNGHVKMAELIIQMNDIKLSVGLLKLCGLYGLYRKNQL